MVTLRICALSLLLVATLCLSAAAETVLLDFYSDQCPPCRQMMPVIAQFEAKGYPVKKVNVTQQQQLASQYGVTGIPCFVMLADGREVGRLVGYQPANSLLTLYQRAGVTPELYAQQQAPSPDRTDRGNRPTPKPIVAQQEQLTTQQRAMAASVRIKITDGQGQSYGSGTIVDSQDGEALVLTCAHIFKGSGEQGKITVDLFDKNGSPRGSAAGQVIRYDMQRDVGLIAVRLEQDIEPMQVAGSGQRSGRGDRVFSIGCDKGNPPTVRESRVTHINKYLGPANIEVAGAPIDGRSGGGLFTTDGKLIGVCNAADPEDDEGLYAALETVHAELAAAKLEFVFESDRQLAAVPAPIPTTNNAVVPRGVAVPSSMRDPVASADSDTEVIVIVRSRSKPQAEGEVLFVGQPSRDWLDMIAEQRQRQSAGQPSQGQVAGPSAPSPIIRGQN